MIKILLFSFLTLLVVGAAGGGYYFYMKQQAADHSIIVVDTVHGIPVPPPYSAAGKVFIVPDMNSTTTILNAVYPTSRRDYPMGTFALPGGVGTGHLVAYDDVLSPSLNNRRAVLISVNTGGPEELYYLAILEGADDHQISSVLIGDRIKFNTITRQGDEVTVSYYVHDRNQSMEEIPTVGTSAIVNIATGALVQAGRNPLTEVLVTDKFNGKYYWVSTTEADGKVVKPDLPDYYTLEFGPTNITLGTDCNTGGAPLTIGDASSSLFKVGTVDATKKTCSSQFESIYFAMFEKVATYSQTKEGKLTLKFTDGGSMQFMSDELKTSLANPATASTTGTTTATTTKPKS